jgi:ABC-type nitrate/sulfonate/bicarbonate transport system permease component
MITSLTDGPLGALVSGPSDEGTTGWLDDVADLRLDQQLKRRAQLRRLLVGTSGVVGLLVVWELAALVLNDSVIFPTVTHTARTFAHYFNHRYPSLSPPLWQDLLISLRRILIGFFLGVVAGVLTGALMFSNRTIRQLADPIIEIIRPLPPLAFIPLLIVWFGIGELPKEALIVLGIVPIMIIATLSALDDVTEDLNLCALTLGASPAYALWHVQIRAALPGIITGMRIAMGGAWTSIVAAEMLAATSGVGFLIMQAGNYLDTAIVFSGIITIAVAELILDTGLRALLRLADPARKG